MNRYRTDHSAALHERARSVIPNGIYGHYAPPAREGMPVFFSRSEGSRFWDVDGNEFIDYMCAYGPMILGYGYRPVEEAAAAQIRSGNTVSLAAPVLVELAEALVEQIHGMDWALFGKNGADATSLATMIARAATGRKKIVTVRGGYHGTVAWMQAPDSPGTVPEDRDFVLEVDWNRPEQLEALIRAQRDEIACFISSPYHHPVTVDNELPAEGYWPRIQKLCNDAGIVLIVDDVRAGLRIDLRGSHVAHGFVPDLVCMGKAIANGHPISAVLGRDALKPNAADVFYTGTQFFNAAPMAAALTTLRELVAADAAVAIQARGRALAEGLEEVARGRGRKLVVSGVPSMPYLRLEHEERERRLHFRWIEECVLRGAYFVGYHNHFLSLAHDDADLARTFEIADEALRAVL